VLDRITLIAQDFCKGFPDQSGCPRNNDSHGLPPARLSCGRYEQTIRLGTYGVKLTGETAIRLCSPKEADIKKLVTVLISLAAKYRQLL
jgi:hypothetical protein